MPGRDVTTVAMFVVNPSGHLNRCLAVARELRAAGADPVVFTGAAWEPDVHAAGARHVDLFAGRSVDSVDAISTPRSCRHVTWAGRHAAAVTDEVRRQRPDVIVSDSFAVVGRVVARELDLPLVNVAAGHCALPPALPALIDSCPEIRVSPACAESVAVLRSRYGMSDASPFSWVAPPSENLNLCGQPPEFLSEDERHALDPVAYLGLVRPRGLPGSSADGYPPGAGPRVYVSFGTIAGRYWPRECRAAMETIADAIASFPGARAVISLGGTPMAASDRQRISRDTVRVRTSVDQWSLLPHTDVFITHHGMNSTHEAAYHEVPMLSYPIWWDQPGLAARCQELGIAIPLADAPLAPLTVDAVHQGLEGIEQNRASMSDRLVRVSEAERATIARRPEVVRRILDLTAEPSIDSAT